MKQQIPLLIIFSLILSISMISATEQFCSLDLEEDCEEELSIWQKIVNWFKNIFSSKENNILEDFDGKVEFHKSMSCGCCGVHSDYIKSKGLKFEIINMEEINPIKEEYGIPLKLYSCHTIILGDYFVEGHMPAEAIEKLITEMPDIAGIALPGMPEGSPGMPGTKQGVWIIYAINHDGTSYEFMSI